MKYLIIYNSTEVFSISEFIEGTAVATPYFFMVAEINAARAMLLNSGVNVGMIDELINR